MNPLTGYRDHRIDTKGRVVVPLAYANKIRGESAGRLYLVPSTSAPCLQAHPATFFERMAETQVPDPILGDPVEQGRQRHFFQNAEPVELKGPGRITLPERFLAYFPGEHVRIAGFNTYLELWDPDTWDEHMAATAGPLPRPRPPAPDETR
jgi:DNA-binding transcriptional regulator/RsmH inhibitor MraZ